MLLRRLIIYVRKAQKLLEEGMAVTQVAQTVGFFDQSHLDRVSFLRTNLKLEVEGFEGVVEGNLHLGYTQYCKRVMRSEYDENCPMWTPGKEVHWLHSGSFFLTILEYLIFNVL